MNADQLLRHPDLLAMSARYWSEQAQDQRRQLDETRQTTAALTRSMRELRGRMRDLQEQMRRARARADRVILSRPAGRTGSSGPSSRSLPAD
ncbi:unnamed protein product [[Actinomadura] parvosata subsp. kistnae]|uniref:Uncharacterized protein n=1 Tax=[Actinomadura] parvosata subsp. kistnae TaxID=1909395 RepID=A0A1U9ZWA4_9ACTN|nr:hypothetical protein [Nonomuraea sp. ATCC 55076]AQZ62241.1 hypothetical protein BKM31_12890 [Nonomuraea sp. ATCC 55076]SPL99771.1 unnamed protein product [Actinomadura parvosata subsp. kistnae]